MLRRGAVSVMVVAALLITACGSEEGGTIAPAGTRSVEGPTAVNTVPAAPADPTPATPGSSDDPVVLPCDDPLVAVNKQQRLPEDCVPSNLVSLPGWASYGGDQQMTSESATALVEMLEDALDHGHEIVAISTYRSYATQVQTYQYHVDTLGQAAADRVSARPGHSEHQLGTTVDLTTAQVNFELTEAFAGTSAGAWLAENAWAYGFVMSYPEGTEHITGYAFEPWHFRYVGVDVARDVRASGLTLHEYLLQRR